MFPITSKLLEVSPTFTPETFFLAIPDRYERLIAMVRQARVVIAGSFALLPCSIIFQVTHMKAQCFLLLLLMFLPQHIFARGFIVPSRIEIAVPIFDNVNEIGLGATSKSIKDMWLTCHLDTSTSKDISEGSLPRKALVKATIESIKLRLKNGRQLNVKLQDRDRLTVAVQIWEQQPMMENDSISIVPYLFVHYNISASLFDKDHSFVIRVESLDGHPYKLSQFIILRSDGEVSAYHLIKNWHFHADIGATKAPMYSIESGLGSPVAFQTTFTVVKTPHNSVDETKSTRLLSIDMRTSTSRARFSSNILSSDITTTDLPMDAKLIHCFTDANNTEVLMTIAGDHSLWGFFAGHTWNAKHFQFFYEGQMAFASRLKDGD